MIWRHYSRVGVPAPSVGRPLPLVEFAVQSKPLRLLIDGYNMLFQSQLVGRGRSPGWLERARGRLLKLLNEGLSEHDLLQTEIVFDASKRGPTPEDQILPSGMVVTFSRRHPEADDLIEERIRAHAHPKSLRVVSADHRIQKCARARRATIAEPELFLQELELSAAFKPKGHKSVGSSQTHEPSDDTLAINETEVEFWLEEFDLKKQDPGHDSESK